MTKTECRLREHEDFGYGSGVDVLIEYCEIANYQPIAVDLARAILREFEDKDFGGRPAVRIRLLAARDARFEVHVDGRLIFSKRATYRLPDADEIFYHVGVAREALEERTVCAVG